MSFCICYELSGKIILLMVPGISELLYRFKILALKRSLALKVCFNVYELSSCSISNLGKKACIMVCLVSFGEVMDIGAVNVVVKDDKLTFLLEDKCLVCCCFFVSFVVFFFFLERPVAKE